MRIDSHQHFWQLSRFHYSWMVGAGEMLKRDFLPPNLEPLMGMAGVDKTVVVQAHQSVEETFWLLDLAKQNDFIAGVVGWVDLTDPRVGETLDRFCEEPYFKGVRHVWHDEPNADWIMLPQVLQGLRELADREIPFDFLTFPNHLKYIPRVLDHVPDLRSVVDHISKPPIASGELEPWRQDLRLISSHPGIHCKISGMVTEADHQKWKVQDLAPYVGAVVEIFGPERLMFGSDWPVCLLAASYGQVVDAAEQTLSGLSEDQKIAVFGVTAERFYRL